MEHPVPIGSCWDLRIKTMTGSDANHIRAFVAISLPGQVKEVLGKIQNQLKGRGIEAAWTRPETLHLTLKFLGNIPCRDLQLFQGAMVQTADQFSPFELSVGGLGVFPGIRQARVVWAGTGGRTDILENLFKRLEESLGPLGIERETRRFSSHITLGRIKKPVAGPVWIDLIQACKDIRSPSFEVQGLDLFKSELRASSAVHTRLFQAGFAGEKN